MIAKQQFDLIKDCIHESVNQKNAELLVERVRSMPLRVLEDDCAMVLRCESDVDDGSAIKFVYRYSAMTGQNKPNVNRINLQLLYQKMVIDEVNEVFYDKTMFV